jgi:TP901 family phage tail tape measure protein
MTDRTVAVTLMAKVQGFVGNLKTAYAATGQFSAGLDKMGKEHKDRFNALAGSAAAMGAGLAGAFLLVTKSAMDFDKEMSAVQSVSGATGAQLDSLRKAAINAGQATAFSAGEAAQAEEELAKAGISTADILGGALTGTLSLAAAGGIGLADAATDAAQAMNIFSLRGKDVGHIADVLAAGANKSATDVGQLAQSLSQGGQVAAQTGLSLEDTVGTLSAFAQAGLVGSDAGTSLKTMLQALANPSDKTAALMQKLGITMYDTTGTFIGMTAFAAQLQDKLGGLTQAARDSAMAQIFGSDAVRAANVLYMQGADGMQGYIQGVDQVGAASDAARQRMDNLAGDVENLKGSIETLTITAGEGASSGLRKLTQAGTNFVNSIAGIPASVQTAGTVIAGLGGAGLLASAGLLKARQKIQEIQGQLKDLGPIGEKAATGLGKISAGAGKLAVALTALQIASAAMGHTIDPSVKSTSDALTKFGKTGDKTGDALKHLDYDLGTLGSGGWAKLGNGIAGVTEGLTGLGNVFDESGVHAKQRIGAIDTALAALVSAGHADDAAAAFDKLSAAAHKNGISIDDLKAGLPQYEGILAGATATQRANTAATADQQHQFGLLHESLQAAIDDVGNLADAFDAINGKSIDVAKGAIQMTQAVDSLAASLKDNKNSFDASTTAGAANTDAYIRGVESARDYAQAVLDQTGSVEQANAAYNQSIDRLNGVMSKAGVAKKTIAGLDKQFASMPGLGDAVQKVSYLNKELNDINGKKYKSSITIEVITKGDTTLVGNQGTYTVQGKGQKFNRWGGIRYAADGLMSLSSAAMYKAGDSPLYGFAEKQTGGEGFVPRLGDYGKSTRIIDQEARWYGGRFVPDGMGGGRAAPVAINITLTGGDASTRAIMREIKSEVSHAFGGNVQVAMGRG